jgi:hypothetical protein
VEVPSRSHFDCTLYDAPKEKLAKISDAELDETIAQTNARATSIANAFMKYCLGPDILGDVFETVPDESLLVSDLVPVDQKIRLCTEILPGLLTELKKGPEDKADAWLNAQLKPFGEDAKTLVRSAAVQWLQRFERESDVDRETARAARKLFEA